ncbi:MAG TPA: dynobactin maturation radical SAM/SPASM protein DynA [Solirubrobacteraceae bacterium]|nr:dynobactin maturation radical SAM/SPASM protein DynA [Solirubrobacteraceae bacterium]
MIFTNVVKPTHLCNLDCKYCYNDDVREPIMRIDTLARVVEQTFDYVRNHTPDRMVNFIWHGGEPMIAGLDYFRRVREFQDRHAGGLRYANSLQTNGTLMNDAWLQFLKQAEFDVSVSIDGPQDLHDRLRVTRGGRGSYERVARAIAQVQEAGIPLGVCVVLSRANIQHVERIYDFLAARRLPFNIIPLNRSGAARTNFLDVGLDAEEYADGWIRMYDRWFDADEDYVFCTDFVVKTRAIAAGRPADCIGLARCADSNISVDPVGDVYPCATLSGSDNTRYGNIVASTLAELMDSAVAQSYRNRAVDPQCSTCKWQHVCHGGCPARAYKFFGDHNRRDYYCPSLFRIYEHVGAKLQSRIKNWTPQPLVQIAHRQQAHY